MHLGIQVDGFDAIFDCITNMIGRFFICKYLNEFIFLAFYIDVFVRDILHHITNVLQKDEN